MKVILFEGIILVLALAGAMPLTAGPSPVPRPSIGTNRVSASAARISTPGSSARISTTSTARPSTSSPSRTSTVSPTRNSSGGSSRVGTTVSSSGTASSGSCVTCHYNLAISAGGTPHQCIGCHTTAANHAAAPDDPTAVPSVSVQATMCRTCHSVPTRPVYQEWTISGHSEVTPAALSAMGSGANGKNCGVCHSGSVRMALLNGQNPTGTPDGVNVPVSCVVCHDQHETTGNPALLRNPVSSFNDFHLLSSDVASTSAFKAKAGAQVNLCAQCHNDRGASWAAGDSAPHHSVQYNYLLGSVGELAGGPATFNPGMHSGLPSSASESLSGNFYLANQCVDCHMQRPDNGNATEHSHDTFTLKYDVCSNCHDGKLAQQIFTPIYSNEVATVISGLNTWAATKAPAALRTSGTVAWEYTAPGGLLWKTNSSGAVVSWTLPGAVPFVGPGAANQSLIPDNIKKARFDLYLFLNDGSFGVHNPALAVELLGAAEDFIAAELNR